MVSTAHYAVTDGLVNRLPLAYLKGPSLKANPATRWRFQPPQTDDEVVANLLAIRPRDPSCTEIARLGEVLVASFEVLPTSSSSSRASPSPEGWRSLLDAGRAGETAGSEIEAALKPSSKIGAQQSAIDTFQHRLELRKHHLTLREARRALSLEGEFRSNG